MGMDSSNRPVSVDAAAKYRTVIDCSFKGVEGSSGCFGAGMLKSKGLKAQMMQLGVADVLGPKSLFSLRQVRCRFNMDS